MHQVPFAEIRGWMFEDALPLWGDAGVDRARGGFYEELSLDAKPTNVEFKRLRAQCRQVYVFSHAALLGWKQGDALAAYGVDYIASKAWLGADGGWAKALNADGSVCDATPDLYDLAFVMFAMAWRYKAARDEAALRHLHATLDFIETKMRAPNGGYWHQLPPQGPRVQNPHMHLLEACLASFDATQDQRFLERAGEVVDLFRTRFFDGRTLAEYFTEDWRRIESEEGRSVEPGHQLEWAWILAAYQRAAGVELSKEAAALVGFAERHGVDPASHATYDEIRDDGAPLRMSSRSWPNTERIKGHLALFEVSGRDPREAVAGSSRLLLDRYLDVKPRGLWLDQFDESGAPTPKALQAAPTSTLYHVFLAFAEVLRLQPRIEALR